MKSKLILIVFALAITITSCSDDFLVTHPTDELASDQFADAVADNPDLIASTMSGIYTLMYQVNLPDPGTGGTTGHDDFGQKGYDIFGDMLSGDMALSISTYGWYRSLTEYTVTTDFTFTDNYQPWRYYYRIIRSCNLVIDALGGNDATPENENNKWVMGQAKAMRAHAYFYLTQYYADDYDPSQPILPLYVTGLDPNGPKVETEVIYDLMISDLTTAIELLDDYNRPTKNQINKHVAQGILAYVYGAMGNFGMVDTLTNEIINTGGFNLVSAAEAVGGFNDVSTSGWMWGTDITLDLGLDLVSWWGQVDVFTYSYAWAGDPKSIDKLLFDAIPNDDVRKLQFQSNPALIDYLCPTGKFYHSNRVRGGQRNIETDYIYMRVAEMYLLNAEAKAQLGNDSGARNRLKDLLNLRIPNTTYLDGLSGQALKDEIYLQTRIELWGEGKSYLAMKRNKATITRGSNHLSNVGVEISYDDDRLTFEIPQAELQNNPFISGQN